MGAKELTSDSLNEQQVLMLRLLKKPLPAADFAQIRQLDETVEDWEDKQNITKQSYERLSKEHFRSTSRKH